MNELRKNILEIPGEESDPISEFSQFEKQMQELIGYKCGMSFFFQHQLLMGIVRFPDAQFEYGRGAWVETERGTQEVDGRWWMNLLPKENFDRFEELLQKHRVDYVRNAGFFRTCCEEAFSQLESLFLFNYIGEKMLLVTSPTPLYSLNAVAYLPELTEGDLRLERAIVEACGKGIDEEGRIIASYTLLPTEREARAYSERRRVEELERLLQGGGFGEPFDVVEVADSNSGITYRYPENAEIHEDSRVLTGNFFVPQIMRVYGDGTTFLRSYFSCGTPIPERYYDKKEGIEQFRGVGSCPSCYPKIKERLRQETLQKINADRYSVFTSEEAQRIGYELDSSRLKVTTRKTILSVFSNE